MIAIQAADEIVIKFGLFEISGNGAIGIAAVVLVVGFVLFARKRS